MRENKLKQAEIRGEWKPCLYSHNLPKVGCTKLDTNQIGSMSSIFSIDRKTVQFDVLNQGHQTRVIFIEYLK